MLWPHGIRYLKWLGLGACIKPFGLTIKGCSITGYQGNKIFSEDYANLYSLISGEILPIDRSLLQQALLAQLPNDILTLGKTCLSVCNEGEHARVIFADGSQDTADLIVGADGIHSAVRQIFNPTASLEYTNHCWWGGIIEQKQVPNLVPDEVYIATTLGKMCVVWPTQGQRFMWYLPVKMPMSNFIQEGDGSAQLLALCSNWNDDVQQVITASIEAKSFHLAINALPPQANWSWDRVVLIGDAAHAVGPILGQGANQAIEDVFVLINLLQSTPSDMPSLLKHYESLRLSRYQRLATLENQTAALMINEDMETLKIFEEQVKDITLASMYQELIPLIDEAACLQLASAVSCNILADNKHDCVADA